MAIAERDARLVQEPIVGKFQEEIATFANFPTLFMGLVDRGRRPRASTTASSASWTRPATSSPTGLDPADYQDYIGEAVEPDSYLKFPYYKPMGYPDGIYRVGPLARLNVGDRAGTPLADAELREFRPWQRAQSSARSTTTTRG